MATSGSITATVPHGGGRDGEPHDYICQRCGAEAQAVTTPEDTATAITLTATDVDGGTLTCPMVLRHPYYGKGHVRLRP